MLLHSRTSLLVAESTPRLEQTQCEKLSREDALLSAFPHLDSLFHFVRFPVQSTVCSGKVTVFRAVVRHSAMVVSPAAVLRCGLDRCSDNFLLPEPRESVSEGKSRFHHRCENDLRRTKPFENDDHGRLRTAVSLTDDPHTAASAGQ